MGKLLEFSRISEKLSLAVPVCRSGVGAGQPELLVCPAPATPISAGASPHGHPPTSCGSPLAAPPWAPLAGLRARAQAGPSVVCGLLW